MVMAGPAPRARMASRSSDPRRNWRPITWSARRNVAKAAIPPNTPRAIASGRMARSAVATTRAGVPVPELAPAATRAFPTTPSISELTAESSPVPPFTCSAVAEYVAQQSANSRVSAGVKSANCEPRASTSSSTRVSAKTTIPTRRRVTTTLGGVAFAEQQSGESNCASELKPSRTFDPMCKPRALAACAFITTSSRRDGSASRPSTSVTRSSSEK